MNEDSPFQVQPAYVQKTSSKKKLITIFFVVLLLVIAGLGALYLLGSSAKNSSAKPTNPVSNSTVVAQTPTPSASSSAQVSATPAAAATVAPTTNPSSLSISVLNGSGTPGAAGQAADALKKAGFTDVTTGNASAYTYQGITVTVKSSQSSLTPQIEKYVSAAYPSAKVTVKTDNTIPTDVQIIVGK